MSEIFDKLYKLWDEKKPTQNMVYKATKVSWHVTKRVLDKSLLPGDEQKAQKIIEYLESGAPVRGARGRRINGRVAPTTAVCKPLAQSDLFYDVLVLHLRVVFQSLPLDSQVVETARLLAKCLVSSGLPVDVRQKVDKVLIDGSCVVPKVIASPF